MRTLPSPDAPALLRRLGGWLQAAHPFPLVMVLCLTALIGVASAGDDLRTGRLALAVAAMLFSQLAIGWTNDYADRDIDAVHQPAKPIPSGLVDAKLMPPAIVLVTAVSFLIGAVLGPLPLALLVVGTAAGLSYDLVIKDTLWSPLAFLLAFAVLPPFVWTALETFRDELALLYLVGAPLAVAAHIANVLPDIETDAAAGRQNLAVVLGERPARSVLGACLIAAPVLSMIVMPFIDYDAVPIFAAILLFSLLSAVAATSYRGKGRPARVWGFRFVVVACVLFAAGWLASINNG